LIGFGLVVVGIGQQLNFTGEVRGLIQWWSVDHGQDVESAFGSKKRAVASCFLVRKAIINHKQIPDKTTHMLLLKPILTNIVQHHSTKVPTKFRWTGQYNV